MAVLRIIGLILLVVACLCVASVAVAVAAFVGLVLHLALFGAPFLLAVVLAIRDWIAYVRWRRGAKKS